jgi:hypothetical protein
LTATRGAFMLAELERWRRPKNRPQSHRRRIAIKDGHPTDHATDIAGCVDVFYETDGAQSPVAAFRHAAQSGGDRPHLPPRLGGAPRRSWLAEDGGKVAGFGMAWIA